MAMKTIALEQATGPALDLLVATCEGHLASITKSGEVIILREGVTDYFDPHRNWGWAGPIIEREGISIIFHEQGHWTASNLHGTVCGEGPTPLIAAMRCFCCSKLGDVVNIPEELL